MANTTVHSNDSLIVRHLLDNRAQQRLCSVLHLLETSVDLGDPFYNGFSLHDVDGSGHAMPPRQHIQALVKYKGM